MKRLLSLITISTLTLSAITAQEQKTVLIGFVPPVTSDGMASTNNNYDVSFGVIANYTKNSNVLALASICNINKEKTKGLQLAGIANYSKNMKGLQLAGIANYSENIDGMQLGTVNITKHINGVQLGIINISKECDGIPIGLINIVANGGKHCFEVFASESFHTALSFKLGIDRFYTIFSAGVKFKNEGNDYALGLGFGSHFNWNEKWGNNVELIAYNLLEDGKILKHTTNMLVQVKAPITFRLSPRCNLQAGPSLNMTISDYRNPQTGVTGSSITPSHVLWNKENSNTRLNIWAGCTIGIELL